MMPEFVTIGVYGFDEAGFFSTLQAADVDTFCDIRLRRGLRGSTYAFANSKRLQARLAELDIRYLHCKELAPTKAVRDLQFAADKETKTAKRQRTTISPDFADAFQAEILAKFDSRQFVTDLGGDAQIIALFCVEREAAACHRSLVAMRLENDLGIQVRHITPME